MRTSQAAGYLYNSCTLSITHLLNEGLLDLVIDQRRWSTGRGSERRGMDRSTAEHTTC